MTEIELSNPFAIRARMAREGLTFHALVEWWSPDVDRMVNPFADQETQVAVRQFMADLWDACFKAEGETRELMSRFDPESTLDEP